MMSNRSTRPDFQIFGGTLFFVLWALLLANTRLSHITLPGAAEKVVVGALLLAAAFYLLKEGLALRNPR
jgi:hypothetical protein